MRMRSAFLVAGLVVVVTGAVMTTTSARWHAERGFDAGVVSGGELSVAVGAGGAQSSNLALDGLSGENLGPGSYRQSPLTVSNDGDIDLRYRRAGVSWGALAGQATLTAVRVSAESACQPTGSPANAGGDFTQFRTLAPGDSETWCLRLALGDNPPQSVSANVVSVEVRAEQVRHGA
ncbi:hypothetical protein MU582_09945 [Nocardioidaceae bacterium SCSIO 66511]|nr:hypothetical protein MU582_09945 [Nocardioidaceae bacterium SCSIO 66511]